VLGTFVSTFIYCLLVLRTVRGSDDEEFVPHLAVTVGVVLAMLSLGVLIFFIHHVATSIQASRIIANVAADLEGGMGDRVSRSPAACSKRCAASDRVCSAKRTGGHCCARQRRLPGRVANPRSARATASGLPDVIAQPSPRCMSHPTIGPCLRTAVIRLVIDRRGARQRHPSLAAALVSPHDRGMRSDPPERV
jgi:hypothetical protein